MTTEQIKQLLLSIKGKSFWSQCIYQAAVENKIDMVVRTIADAANDNLKLVTDIVGKQRLGKILLYGINNRIICDTTGLLDRMEVGQEEYQRN